MQQIAIQIEDCHYFRFPCQNLSSLQLRSKFLTGLSFRNIILMIFSVLKVLFKSWGMSRE
jgi:hypothetical protein